VLLHTARDLMSRQLYERNRSERGSTRGTTRPTGRYHHFATQRQRQQQQRWHGCSLRPPRTMGRRQVVLPKPHRDVLSPRTPDRTGSACWPSRRDSEIMSFRRFFFPFSSVHQQHQQQWSCSLCQFLRAAGRRQQAQLQAARDGGSRRTSADPRPRRCVARGEARGGAVAT